ncbi:MAG TPA: tripartite tricarboxylate transporter substrate-binding protein [Xanthobacteraceae bacterium]|jgi:tripartite-type tricarboxylate transporter receptor subunit TctC
MTRTTLLRNRLLLGLAAVFAATAAGAQSVEQFYRGRTINFMVASAPGGINDLMARLISRHLGAHIPGKPTLVVQNMGTAGLALANRLYGNADRDGTTIAIIERGTPQLAVQGDPNARFDPLKMGWLGSVSSYAHDAYVFWVNSGFHAKTVADLRQPGSPVARIGTTGAGATNLVFTQISKDVLGLNIQNVRGYRGAAEVFLAQQRGEVDGQVVGLSAIKVGQASLYQAGAFRGLIQFARTARLPELANVPTGRELTKDPKALALIAFAETPFFMALPLVTPPEIPTDRLKALQTAFTAMTSDAAFVDEIGKMGQDLSPIDGDAVRALIARMGETPKDVIARFNEIVTSK